MKRVSGIISSALLAAFITAPLPAVTFQGHAVGSWLNVVSTDAADIFGVNNGDAGGLAYFNWGVPATTTFNNQFTFDGVGSDGDPDWISNAETPFKLGDFGYRNGSTTNSAGIVGVSLNVALTIITPALGANDFLFNYRITNTPNSTGNPVLDGDIVTIIGQPSPTTFNYDGKTYTLDILGFSNDSGATIRTDFSSPEGATASAELYARITEDIHGIPDHAATVLLLGAALLGLPCMGRIGRTARR